MRLLAIGDVHGNRKQLQRLLESIRLCPDDQLVMLGDYIDRGSDSNGVVADLLALATEHPKTVFLRGNHEQMLLDALFELELLTDWTPLHAYLGSPALGAGEDTARFEANGGLATLRSYAPAAAAEDDPRQHYQSIAPEHVAFLKQTACSYRYRDFLFVHAGTSGRDPLGEQDGPYALLWSRCFQPCVIAGREMTVVHGHTPCPEPLITAREINLDTGAGYGRLLTGCDVLTGECWQA